MRRLQIGSRTLTGANGGVPTRQIDIGEQFHSRLRRFVQRQHGLVQQTSKSRLEWAWVSEFSKLETVSKLEIVRIALRRFPHTPPRPRANRPHQRRPSAIQNQISPFFQHKPIKNFKIFLLFSLTIRAVPPPKSGSTAAAAASKAMAKATRVEPQTRAHSSPADEVGKKVKNRKKKIQLLFMYVAWRRVRVRARRRRSQWLAIWRKNQLNFGKLRTTGRGIAVRARARTRRLWTTQRFCVKSF